LKAKLLDEFLIILDAHHIKFVEFVSFYPCMFSSNVSNFKRIFLDYFGFLLVFVPFQSSSKPFAFVSLLLSPRGFKGISSFSSPT
jgi:hypothetical protein